MQEQLQTLQQVLKNAVAVQFLHCFIQSSCSMRYPCANHAAWKQSSNLAPLVSCRHARDVPSYADIVQVAIAH
jgi:hypothetical protein